jgi:hypothetical protein
VAELVARIVTEAEAIITSRLAALVRLPAPAARAM